MIKCTPILIGLILTFSSCLSDAGAGERSDSGSEEARKSFFDNVYNDDQIETQVFVIDGRFDTTLIGEKGSKLRIYKESLILDGLAYDGEIEVHFKEAFEPIDFVLGNLTTVSKYGNLQSDGMIFFEAYGNNEKLHINPDAPIGVIMPSSNVDNSMTTWHGRRNDDSVMEWSQDERMLNDDVVDLNLAWTTIWFFHHNYTDEQYEELNKKFNDSIDDFLWNINREPGDKFMLEECEIEFIKRETKPDSVDMEDWAGGVFLSELMNVGNINEFKEDPKTSYLFTLNDIGWANIDRLFSDPRAEEVELFTAVDNGDEYDFVYSTLLLKNKSMYLPGYQREDNTYGFTHYDSEKPTLPIGAKAVVFCTAYKDGVPHFDYQEFDISKKQKVKLKLEATEMEDMKKELENLLNS